MRAVAVNIGSNLGDKRQNLHTAIGKISEFAGPLRTSSIYETEAWGYTSCNPFCNIGAVFNSDLPAEEIYARLHQIELAMGSTTHRNEVGEYIDRIIDIDIIYIGDEIIDTQTLQIPHPRLHLRDFVILPLLELTPDWIDPRSKKSIRRIAQEAGL